MNITREAIKGVKWTTVSSVIHATTGLLKVSILARFLEKSDFGLMAIIMFVLGFMNLFMDMGISTAILHKQDISKKQYASLYWANVVFSVLLFGAIFLIAKPVAEFYNEPELIVLLPIMGSSLILSAIGRQYRTIEEKNLNFRYIAIVTIASYLISLLLAIILAVNGFGIYSMVLGVLSQHVVSNCTFLISGIRKMGLLFHFAFAEIKDLLRIGLYHVGGQMINYFNRDLDILLVGKFFGSETLGGYSLAKELVFRPTKIVNPILTRVASPILSKIQNNLGELRMNYLKLINAVASINIPIYLILIVTAPIVVRILFGEGFDDIFNLVRILSVYMMFRTIGNPVIAVIIATGRTDLNFIWSTVTLVVMPIAVVIGSQFSIDAVAICLTIAIALLFIPNWWFLIYKTIGVKLSTYVYWIIPGVMFFQKR